MDSLNSPWALIAFSFVIACTFVAAWKGRRDALKDSESDLSKQGLNRWLVALSAGATANSGFVVTGAVGLGYAYGVHWLMLPLAWFLGDLIFWQFFPHKINAAAKQAGGTTLTDLLAHNLPVGRFHPLVLLTTLIVILGLGGYTLAQWVAGQKFLDGAFGLSGHWTLAFFAVLIIIYSSLGQFRGSVYADSFQAVTRLLGTLAVLGMVIWLAVREPDAFRSNMQGVGDGFFSVLGGGTLISLMGFLLGYAAAALGFGLGQPQVTTRYFAARDPEEARAAKWIYIGYVQFTWAAMTLFGVLLRGVMPDIADPEQGMTVFAAAVFPALLLGLVVGDIFGAIASTANSLLVAMAQAVRSLFTDHGHRFPLWPLTLGLGLVSLAVALLLDSGTSVFNLAITSVSFMAAGLAPAVAVKVSGWRHTAFTLTATVVVGLCIAIAWYTTGMSAYINEAFPGIAGGLATNLIVSKLRRAA